VPTAKPRYTGDRTQVHQFSDQLRSTLRTFFPPAATDPDSPFAHPADTFVELVLSAAHWAAAEMAQLSLRLRRDELQVEQRDLLKALTRAHDKLTNLSLEYRRLLDQSADPAGCADAIAALQGHVDASAQTIDTLPRKQRPDEVQHEIAVELAVRVLHVLKDNRVSTAATHNKDFKYTSAAVEILKAIGDDMELLLDHVTWRDVIVEAKQRTPLLK
jgi:hypothetical protein